MQYQKVDKYGTRSSALEMELNHRCIINLRPKKTQRRKAQTAGASPRLLVRQRGGADGYPAVRLRSSHSSYTVLELLHTAWSECFCL